MKKVYSQGLAILHTDISQTLTNQKVKKMNQYIKISILLLLFTGFLSAQSIQKVEPPFWWVGMNNTNLQLLIKGDNISTAIPEINYPGVSIIKVQKGSSLNYLFIDLKIAAKTSPGKFEILLTYKNKKRKKYSYELKIRQKDPNDYIGFNSSDVIYLITPDRFANANLSNDIIPVLKERSINRGKDYSRHGGDIQGITDNLGYIEEMGFTAIWSTPLLTNDMYKDSYHGYARTDFYQVDPRFGTLDEYINLSKKASERGIKLIMDQVVNHCGSEHWWMADLPFSDWVNYQKEYENGKDITVTNHRRTTNQDIYASTVDKNLMSEGWFVSSMPDLNQKNPFMAKYLIQNSIWWIETLGLGGIRQDTYPYPDKEFMSKWAGAIMKEYPNFSIVGEEWSHNPLLVGYWQNNENRDGYKSNLSSSMDFPMQNLIVKALKEKETWGSGLVKMYEGLANDFSYPNPKGIMIFPDNHDMDRIYTQLDQNLVLTKMALSYTLTLPRIAQIYYGTEILMENSNKPGDHGLIRSDFPGGWENDKVNAFTGSGLTSEQKDMQSYLRTILNYRKNSEAIHHGKTIHFSPKDGIYLLFRITDDEVVVHILNKNEDPVTLDLKRFEEIDLDGKTLKNIITGEEYIWKDKMELKSKGSILLTSKLIK